MGDVDRKEEIVYLYGQSGTGKTTLARELFKFMKPCLHIDGDQIRNLTGNKDYTVAGRMENIEFAHKLALLAASQGINVLLSLVSPYNSLRDDFKDACKGYKLTCIGLRYDIDKVKRGKESFWTHFQYGKNLVLDTGENSVEECITQILAWKKQS